MTAKAHPKNALSATFVSKTKQPGRYADGHGLYLVIDPSGARRWEQRLQIRGKRRTLGLGGYPLVTLAMAREAALANKRQARAGHDPLTVKRIANGIPTFAEATAIVFDLRRPGWRSARHAQQWIESLNEHAMPKLGTESVASVDAAGILGVLVPLWHKMPVTAQRLRQRIGTVLKWAIAQGYRLDNPADAVAYALPRQSCRPAHQSSIHYEDVADAIDAVRASNASPSARLALEFMVLTAARSGEVTGCTWQEIDLKGRTWTVPAERMKAGREHRVPLSDRALAILDEARALGDGRGLVFPGPKTGRAMFRARFSRLLKLLGIEAVPHGFRTSFRVWAQERTNFPREVCEAALAHTLKDKAEAAYARSDLFEKRRELMPAVSVVPAPVEDTIREYIECAASCPDHWDALACVADVLTKCRQPLGDALGAWNVEALRTCRRPDARKAAQTPANALRNHAIIAAVRALERCGIPPTRHRDKRWLARAHGFEGVIDSDYNPTSGYAIVAEAFGNGLTERATAAVWEKRSG